MFSIQTLSLATLLTLASLSLQATAGGNSGGGASPENVEAGAIKLLVQGEGLKKAMVNYLGTVQISQVDDAVVRLQLTNMMLKGSLIEDIKKSNYVLATPSTPCKDAYNQDVPAATTVGALASDVCFDVDKLVTSLRGFSEEDVMVQLAGLAIHEHVHHYQTFSDKLIQQNEAAANRVAGYVLITAKFVQLPLLHWIRPGSGPAAFLSIEAMYTEIKAREQAFLAPAPADYDNYPGYLGRKDRGVVRLLPREKYDDKLSIRGGGAYYSFTRLDHGYGYGSDISLEQGHLSTGFAGCDYGYFVDLGTIPLEAVNEQLPALQFLTNYTPPQTESQIRVQQATGHTNQNGFHYSQSVQSLEAGQTFALRSISFSYSDTLTAFKIIRFDEDGSVLLAWKKLRQFPAPSCH